MLTLCFVIHLSLIFFQIMFLKDRMMAEQFDKENTEQILQSDLDQARQEIGIPAHFYFIE